MQARHTYIKCDVQCLNCSMNAFHLFFSFSLCFARFASVVVYNHSLETVDDKESLVKHPVHTEIQWINSVCFLLDFNNQQLKYDRRHHSSLLFVVVVVVVATTNSFNDNDQTISISAYNFSCRQSFLHSLLLLLLLLQLGCGSSSEYLCKGHVSRTLQK